MGAYNYYPLGKIASVQTGPFGSQLHMKDYVEKGTPIITVEHLGDNKILHDNLPCVSEQDCIRLSKYDLREGDIVFSRVGSVDRCAYVKKEEEGWLFSGRCLRIRVENENVDPRYLSFYFGQPLFKSYIRQVAVGATMPSLNTSIMSELSIPIPPLTIQKKIAAILSSLDDKIELNTRMNKVLEEIARALFRRWFVEFEFPNAEGKPYKSAGGKMVESEMGSVPEGWRVGTLDNVVDIIGGGTPKTSTSEYWNGSIPWFSVVDAPNDGDIFVIDTEKHITQLGIENSSTRLLPVGTTIISARGTVGKCAVVGVPMTMNQSCYGIRGKEEGVDYFVYFTIRGMVSELQSKGHGSVFNTITRDTINTQKIVVPDVSMMKNYNDHVTPLLQKIQTNLTENKHLSELRDSLLPKLMNGEMSI